MRLFLIAAIAAGFAAPAFAEDFTVTVPVNFRSLPPNIHTLKVSCQIFTNSNSEVVAAKAVDMAVTGGAYAGDVVLAMNAVPDRDPGMATRYKCVAWLVGRGATGADLHYYSQGEVPAISSQRIPLAAGAPFVINTGIVPLP